MHYNLKTDKDRKKLFSDRSDKNFLDTIMYLESEILSKNILTEKFKAELIWVLYNTHLLSECYNVRKVIIPHPNVSDIEMELQSRRISLPNSIL